MNLVRTWIDMDTNVLITSCGRRVELVKEFVKARNNLGVNGNVIAVDINHTAPALHFADYYELVPRINSADYIDSLISVIKKYNINLIIPTIDTELQVLADNKTRIKKETGAIVMVSDPVVIDICNNKFKSAEFFKKNGFAVPKTLTLQDIEDKNYAFPLFIKPLNGSSSVNAFKVNTERELSFFIDYIDDPIVQECVSGIEYTIDAFIDFNGKLISAVPRQRLQTRGGEILKGVIDMNENIISDITRMIDKLKPIGHITIQGFLGEDNIFRYIEINPRFGGGAPMSIKAGANSCEWLYKIMNGTDIESAEITVKDRMVFSRFDDCIMIEDK